MHTTDNQEKQHYTRDLSLPAMNPLIPGSPQVTNDREDEGTSEIHLSTSSRWSLSPLDWHAHAHAIDTGADHPLCLDRPLRTPPPWRHEPARHPARTTLPSLCPVEHHHGTRSRAVIEVSDHIPTERARLVAKGRRTDDDSTGTLVVIHELGGTGAIHGLGNPGVRLSATDMAALAEAILERPR
jgi:hypothetical protein